LTSLIQKREEKGKKNDFFPVLRSRSIAVSPPLVAIIGRPNVGKSTLFNRIVGGRTAIVDDVPGVTRDRNVTECRYQRRIFQLMDTGGLDPSASEEMLAHIKQQSELAIAEADLLIVTMDGRTGLTSLDEEIVSTLRAIRKPVFFAINKIDTPKWEAHLADFYKIGQSHVYPVSAEHGAGVDELLEALFPFLPIEDSEEHNQDFPRVSVVGRPNVGKSTLVNTLLKQERLVVSRQPGTTRDSVDTLVSWEGKSYVFTDTAGIRRRGRIDRRVEGFSVARAIRALGRSDIAVLLLDGVEGVTEQDTKIAGLIEKQGKGCILLVNKWDLQPQTAEIKAQYLQALRRRFPFFTFVPVVFGSAFSKKTMNRLFPFIHTVMTEYSKRIPTGRLNQFLQRALEKHPLPLRRGNPVKSVYMTQVSIKPPTFALFLKHPEDVPSHYSRYLENSLRETFDFTGTVIKILIRGRR